MADKPEVPPVDKATEALRDLAKREDAENVVDQQTASSAAAAKEGKKS